MIMRKSFYKWQEIMEHWSLCKKVKVKNKDKYMIDISASSKWKVEEIPLLCLSIFLNGVTY